MVHKLSALLVAGWIIWLMTGVSGQYYASPGMAMGPMGGMGGMSPYGGYHVARRRRHRSLFQRMTGRGRRYKYYLRPNSYGMYGRGMASPYGMPNSYGMTSTHMTPYGMGSPGMVSPYGMGAATGYASMPGGFRSTSVTMSTGMGMNPMNPMMNSMNPMMNSMTGLMNNPYMSSSALAQACRSQDTLGLRTVQCAYMSPHDIHYCFAHAQDPMLAALVRKCKGAFTKNPYQMAAHAVELILANKPMAFGHLVSRGTCAMLGHFELNLMLKSAVLSRSPNTFAFVDYILSTCRVPTATLAAFQTQALMTGDVASSTRLQRAAMYPVNLDAAPRIIYLASGRVINLMHNSALAMLNGRDMANFGKIGHLCRNLRPQHLTNPLFSVELLGEMNENCFRNLRPRIFFFMSADMIKRFRWWRSATPHQIKMIPPGPPIQAVPFYQLGMHTYLNSQDHYHPCSGINKVQRISIQLNRKVARAFYDRCRASGAASLRVSVALLAALIGGYLTAAFLF